MVHCVHVTREQIEAKLKSLNIDKSPGPDLLHPRILYEVRQEIAEPLKKEIIYVLIFILFANTNFCAYSVLVLQHLTQTTQNTIVTTEN